MTERLTTAIFLQERMGLVWIKTRDRDSFGGGEFSPEYDSWLLVEAKTDRMLMSIDAPYPDKLCFVVIIDGVLGRRFISLEGAQRYAVGKAITMLQVETVERARDRKVRRMARVAR